MGWRDDPVVQPRKPWEDDPVGGERVILDPNQDMSRGDALWYAGMMGMGDTVRGVGQISGIYEGEEHQSKLHELMNHPEWGTEVKAAYFGGLFLDPVGWALPAAKARNAWKMFKYGLGTGAVAGGLGYVDPEAQSLIGEGKLGRLEQAGLGMAAGGVLAPAIGRGIPKLAEATGLKKLAKGYENRVGKKAWNSITRTPELATTPMGALYGYNYDPDASTEDKMRNALKGALIGGTAITKLTPGGRELRQKVGRAVVPNFGLTRGYIHKKGKAMVEENRILMRFNDMVKELQKLEEPARYALYKVVVGEGTPDQVTAGMAKEIRTVVKQYGQEMVDLGLLSKDTFRKNIDTYLHRVYKDPENIMRTKGSNVAMSNDDVIKFSFNELKMRGKIDTIRGRDWEVDRQLYAGKNPDGTFTYDIIKADGIDTGGTALYLHKDADHYYKKLYDGEIKPESVVVRKDWTPEERLQMGEVQDIAIALERTGQLMANDISAARFYKAIADEFSVGDEMSKELRRERGFTEFIPDTRIGDTGRKRYGELAGRWVDKNVYNDIVRIEKYRTGDDWTRFLDGYKKLNQVWKTTKTVLNLPVHFNNAVSNMQVYDGLGGKSIYFDDAVKDLWQVHVKGNEPEGYRLAKEYGVFGGGFVENELGDSSRKILQSYADATKSTTDIGGRFGIGKKADRLIDEKLRMMPKYVEKLGKATKKYSYDAMAKLYQSEDYVYRLGLFKTLIAEGLEKGIKPGTRAYEDLAIVAAKTAREGFVDYSIKTPLLQALRHTAFPFVAYMYGIIPRIGEIAVTKPWKMAKWGLIWHGINSVMEQLGDPEKIEKERGLMLPGQKGTVWGVPGYIPKEIKVPFIKGPKGEEAYWNISRAKPGGEIFEPATERGYQVPLLPQWLQPFKQGGAAGALARSAVGIKDFSEQVIPTKDRPMEALRQFLPNVPIPGFPSYAGTKMQRAFSTPEGFLSETKDPQTPLSAIMQSLGPKVHYVDPKKLQMRQYYRYQAKKQNITDRLRTLERDKDENMINKKSYLKEKKALEKELTELADKFDQYF